MDQPGQTHTNYSWEAFTEKQVHCGPCNTHGVPSLPECREAFCGVQPPGTAGILQQGRFRISLPSTSLLPEMLSLIVNCSLPCSQRRFRSSWTPSLDSSNKVLIFAGVMWPAKNCTRNTSSRLMATMLSNIQPSCVVYTVSRSILSLLCHFCESVSIAVIHPIDSRDSKMSVFLG